MNKKVIAIIRAARAPGRGLIRAIADDKDGGFTARAVARDVEGEEGRYLLARGAEVVAGHMGDATSLKEAFTGAYGAFCILMPGEAPFSERRISDAIAMAQAAKDVGLEHVIWAALEDISQTKPLGDDEATPMPLVALVAPEVDVLSETMKPFSDLGVPTTFLRASWPSAVATGTSAEEIGRAAYGIFQNRELIGQTVAINPEMLPIGREPATADEAAVAAPVPPQRRSGKRAIAIVALLAVLVVAVTAVAWVRRTGDEPPQDGIEVAETPPPAEVKRPEPVDPVAAAPVAAAPVAAAPVAAAPKAPAVAPTVPSAPTALAGTRPVAPATDPSRAPLARSPTPGHGAASAVAMRAPSESAANLHRFQRRRPVFSHGRQLDPRSPGAAGANDTAQAPASTPELGSAPAAEAKTPSPRPSSTGSPTAAAAPAPARPAAKPVEKPVEKPPASAAVSESPAAKNDAVARGTIDRRRVAAAVRPHQPEVQACYERALMDATELHGRLTVRATIDPSGHVVSASANDGVAGGARLQACVLAAFKGWVFPAPSGDVAGEITYSFTFQ